MAPFAVVATEIFVTYARLPARDLYHVSGSGLAGGASRALVFLNFPTALMALPLLVLLGVRLASRAGWVVAGVAVGLCAVVFWPGVVDQANLDARPINALPALGVLLAFTLTVIALRRRPAEPVHAPAHDRLRLGLALVLAALALPWLAADLGFSFNGVPVLGTLFQTGELRSQPGLPGLPGLHPAVHHGHHHGVDGLLLVLSALFLSRLLADEPPRRWHPLLGGYLALLFAYGIANFANDIWLEQVVKRGWTNAEIPDVTKPTLSLAWLAIVLFATVIWTVATVAPGRPSSALQ